MKEVTVQELTDIIRQLPHNKAPGPTDITYDDIKLFQDPEVIRRLCNTINRCYKERRIPETAKLAQIINLPKEEYKGSLDKLRPITLLDTLRKLLSLIITRRITKVIDTHDILKGYNYGFRTGRSTADNLRILRLIIEDANHLDIYKAYDSVPYDAVEKSLKRLQIPEELVQLIMTIMKDRKLTISTPYGATEEFIPQKGLPQGDALSPILWAIFYDPLLCHLQENTPESIQYQYPSMRLCG